MIDGSRAPPTAIVSDGMVAITNAPPVQQMFTSGFAHTFLPHHSFPAPQVYLIATPEGSYFTYGLPTPGPGVQMPRPSSPPIVPNVVDTDDNSGNTFKVPSNDGNGSDGLIHETVNQVSDELNEELMIESNENNDFDNNQNFRQTNETIVDSNREMKNCVNNENNNGFENNSDLQSNESKDNNKSVNSSQATSASTTITSAINQKSISGQVNVWSMGGNSQRSWADLFKDSSSASIHNSLISSSNETSSVLTTGSLVSHSYNNIALSESDSHLNSSINSVVISCESEAQIQCIPMRNDSFARKLAKRIKEITLKHSLPYLIPSGFVNRGNWCYINAVCLMSFIQS